MEQETKVLTIEEILKCHIIGMCETLLALARHHENEMSVDAYAWIMDDLDQVEVQYLGKDPEGDRQEEFAKSGEKLAVMEAYDLLRTRLENTLKYLGA